MPVSETFKNPTTKEEIINTLTHYYLKLREEKEKSRNSLYTLIDMNEYIRADLRITKKFNYVLATISALGLLLWILSSFHLI